MSDIARDQIDYEIAHAMRVEQMLLHLATVVQEAPKRRLKGETYPNDAEEALRFGAYLAHRERENWEHVRAFCDASTQGDPTNG